MVSKRLCSVLSTWVWQLLSLTIPFAKGSTSVLVSAEWMCQQPWWHPQWSFCYCTSKHMILSSENKGFCNVGAALYFVDLPSILAEPACKKTKLLGGWQFFLIICPLQPWHFLFPKQQEEQHLGKFSSGSSRVQAGEYSIGTFSSARIALVFFNYLPRPTCIFLLTAAFFCFLFTQMSLLYLS